MLIPGLVRVPAVVVRVLVEWYRPVSIMLPATPHVAPVIEVVAASFLLVGCSIFVVETTLTTNEQRLSSLVSLFECRITVPTELLLTTTPSQKLRPRMWRL